MLKLFQRNTVVQVIFIFVVTALLWAKAFVNPQPMVPTGLYSPLYDLLCHLSLSPIVATSIAVVLVLLGAFFFNLTLAKVGLVSQNSLLPALLFIVAISAYSPALTPSLLASLITIAIVNKLMLHSTLLAVSSDKIFATAALIGIASMIYFPSLALIIAYFLIAINYRLYSWRDWMVFLLGLLAPYLLLWSVQLFTNDLLDSFSRMASTLSTSNSPISAPTTLSSIANAVLIIVFLVSLVVVWSRLGERTIVWQKNATTIMLLTVAAIAMLPFTQFFPVSFHFLAIPFAFCIDHRFSLTRRRVPGNSRRSWRKHLFDLLFIIIILAAILC